MFMVITQRGVKRVTPGEWTAALDRLLHHGNAPLAVALTDLDGFAGINETHGAEIGDRVLEAWEKTLAGSVPVEAVVARLGGDEYSVALPGYVRRERADPARGGAQPLQRHGVKGLDEELDASVGIAAAPPHGSTGEELYRAAGEALMRAKREGSWPGRHLRRREDDAQEQLLQPRQSRSLVEAVRGDEPDRGEPPAGSARRPFREIPQRSLVSVPEQGGEHMAELKVEIDPAEVGFDATRLARIDSHFARYVDDGLLPGWLLVVSRGGHIVHLSTYGQRDKEAGLPIELDTLFRVYSMTKPITSVAAMMLYEEGGFELKDPGVPVHPVVQGHAGVHRRVRAGARSPSPRPSRCASGTC